MSEYVYMNSLDHARREDEVQLWHNSSRRISVVRTPSRKHSRRALTGCT